MGRMKYAHFKGPGRIELLERDIPSPGEGQVLVRIGACGICAHDLDCNAAVDAVGHAQGHEMGGTVAAVGKGVEDLQLGDIVAVYGSMPCLTCENCVIGKTESCFHRQGCKFAGFAEYYLTDRKFLLPVPDLSIEAAALLEPLTVSIRLVRDADLTWDHSVLLIGAGPIGLMTIPYCRRFGVSKIYVSELSGARARTDLALKWGASAVVHPDKQDIIKELRQREPRGIDRILLTARPSLALQDAISVAAEGAVIAYVGMEQDQETDLRLAVNHFHFSKMKLVGSNHNPCSLLYPEAVRLIKDDAIQSQDIISHRFHLRDINEAFRFAAEAKAQAIKTIIVMDEQ